MRLVLFLLAALVLGFSVTRAGDRVTGKMFATRSETIATHGMVATSQPLAAMVGIEILKKGGSAVDAAIATNAMLGLTEPTGSGIGGDLFAIVWDNKTKKQVTLKNFQADPAPDGWHSVQFGIVETMMLAYINGKSVCEITVDPKDQLPAGRICIGTWNCDASFRQVQMKMLK